MGRPLSLTQIKKYQILALTQNGRRQNPFELNIPAGIPLVYTFDQDMNVLEKRYIGDPAVIEAKVDKVANQGKAK